MLGKIAQWVLLICGTGALNANPYVPGEAVSGTFQSRAEPFLENHCFDCHDDETSEAGLNLFELGPVDQINAAVWKSVWSQVAMGEMPPKNKAQPEVIDRLKFSDWIVGELRDEMKGKGGFKADLDPKKANYIDHDLLFGELPKGIMLKPTSSPTRLWRILSLIHI